MSDHDESILVRMTRAEARFLHAMLCGYTSVAISITPSQAVHHKIATDLRIQIEEELEDAGHQVEEKL